MRRGVVAALAAALVVVPAAEAKVTARGSIGQAYVTGAKAGQRLTLLDARGRIAARGRADRLGSRIFRDLGPGRYRLRGTARRLTVLRPTDHPRAGFYRRTRLKAGLNYVRMRDGVELAMTVRLPPGRTLDPANPLPTVIEYSGYQVAAPNDLLGSLGRDDPLAPAAGTAVGSLIAPQLGYAVVSVQMRGSGCSGGAFDLFDLPTTYDGYDAVETVAAQPWVRNGKVGLVGISFSGISQLFVAGTRPPHLAAIAPLSVTDDLYAGTGNPGGIANVGFARSWIRDRMRDARPAPRGGQPYARALVRAGDRRCRANQRLRLQTQNAVRLLDRTPLRAPRLYANRTPARWMSRIAVPTFLAGQFHDEQTGGHFATSLDRLAENPRTWITLQNGVHADSLGPDVLTRWAEFLDLYVAGEVPEIPEPVLGLSAQLYQFLAGAPAAPLRQTRFAGTTDVAAARAAFERDPRVRLLMENGAGPAGPGSIGAAWELAASAWPVPEARPATFFLGPDGTLAGSPPPPGAASYVADPSERPATTLPGDGEADAWKARPPYDWRPLAPGHGVGFTTPPLERDVVIAGGASLDLRLASSTREADLQATLSEVRPDGRETYVQNGWLRASQRALAPSSTVFEPEPTHRRRQPLTPGAEVAVRVPILPVAHAFRAGSRIRVTLQAPGGDRPRWRFATAGGARVTIALGASRLVLPQLPGVTAPTPLPAPGTLRGQPDRAYVAAPNGG